DFDERNAAQTVGPGHKALRHDVLKRLRQAVANGRLLALREHTDDALDGLGGVDGVQRGHHEVACLGRLQRDLDRLAIAHLTHQNDLRRLAQRRAQREAERRRVAVQLALVNGRLLVPVDEFDRILDRQDVNRPLLVHAIDDRRQRRGLARSGRARDEPDAVPERNDVRENLRQSAVRERRNLDRNQAHYDRAGVALLEAVHAEPRDTRERIRKVGRSRFLELLGGDGVRTNQILGNRERLVVRQYFEALERQRNELALRLHLRRTPGREDQVAHALPLLEHGRDQLVGWDSLGRNAHRRPVGRGPGETTER